MKKDCSGSYGRSGYDGSVMVVVSYWWVTCTVVKKAVGNDDRASNISVVLVSELICWLSLGNSDG